MVEKQGEDTIESLYSAQHMEVTIVIPAYNEAAGIRNVLQALTVASRQWGTDVNIIVVDDGSMDETAAQAKTMEGIKIIRHNYNKGYGAAIKTGVQAAETEWVITYDADGQHSPDLIEKLLPAMTAECDLVVGKREGYKGPWIRQPGKWLICLVANHLTGHHIPDLNSGLRAFRREQFLCYAHLFPNGFSLSTTSTVCFFKEGLNIMYVPIRIHRRNGKSTIRPRDAIKTLMLILRLTMLFSPLRIFLPTSVFLGCLTMVITTYEMIFHRNVSTSGAVLLTFTGLVFFFGLLADQVSALRRDMGKRLS